MAAYTSIRAVTTDGNEAITPIPAETRQAFLAIAADAQEGYFYYTDAFAGIINRRFSNGTGR